MTTQHNDRPLPEVLKSIGDDLGRIVSGEIALLKTEMSENMTKIGTGAGLFGGAGVVGLFALEFILLALMFGIAAMGLPFWASALIVGLLLGGVAAMLALSGKKKVANASVAPVETMEQVRTDLAMIKADVARMRSH